MLGQSSFLFFFFWPIDIQLLQYRLLKRLVFLHWIASRPLSKNSWAYLCGSISGFSILFHSSTVYPLLIPHCLDFSFTKLDIFLWILFQPYFLLSFWNSDDTNVGSSVIVPQVPEALLILLILCIFSPCCLDWLNSIPLSYIHWLYPLLSTIELI